MSSDIIGAVLVAAIIIAGLIVFDLLALRYGADSRPVDLGPDHRPWLVPGR